MTRWRLRLWPSPSEAGHIAVDVTPEEERRRREREADEVRRLLRRLDAERASWATDRRKTPNDGE